MTRGLMVAYRYCHLEDTKRMENLLARRRRRTALKYNRMEENRQATRRRMNDVEDDLGRALLLTVSLQNVLMKKGLISSEDLDRMAAKVDLLDGSADGALDPARVRPAKAKKPKPDESPEEFFKRLEEDG